MKYGLIGETLVHSHSVPIHKAFGVTDYELCPIPENELDSFLKKRDFRGLNVTIPYKKTVMPYCDELDERAKAVGSVNTLVLGGDGLLRGFNTDFSGFELMAERACIDFSGKKVLILGTGGTSLTARAVVNAHNAKEIVIVSRSGETNYENIYQKHPDAEVIINTTPVGMYPLCGKSPVELERFPSLCGVLDVIYNPRRTALMLEAERLGIPHGDGLIMLVEQARIADEMYLGRVIPKSETDRVCSKISREIENIIIIGMPGSGKSSVGRGVAEKLGREFIDMDDYIIRKAKMSVPDIFAKFGEPRFREMEREAARELGAKSSLVIATGGGTPVDERNHAPLRQNGRVYQIGRALDELATDGRPLSTSLEALREMQERRRPSYEKLRDKLIVNDSTIENAVDALLNDFNSN